MLKSITQSLIITTLVLSPVFADDEMAGTFEQQTEVDYFRPNTERKYLATLAPMESEVARYIGVNVNLGAASYQPKITAIKNKTVFNSDSDKSNTVNYGGGAYGGLGINFSHFYLGGELSLATSLANKRVDTINSCNTVLKVKQPLIVGLDIIPGYLTHARNILFYGRLGVGSSLYQLKIADTTSTTKEINNTTSKIVFGARAGLGVEFVLNDMFSIRTEYLYSKYKNASGSYTDATSGNVYSYKVGSPGVNQFNLGLTLRF